MAEAAALFRILLQEPENKLCFECGKLNPQWASVPYGVILCLECAGGHRSLGVHLSFVRSLTMDSWTDKQLASMKAGGNAACKEFFKRYNMPDTTNLCEKYSSSIAQAYKAKIKALSEGQNWSDPEPSDLSKKYPAISSNKPTFALNSSTKSDNPPRTGSAPPGVGPSNPRDRGYQDYSSGPDYTRSDRSAGSDYRSGGSGRGGYGSSSLSSASSQNRNLSNSRNMGGAGGSGDPWEYFASWGETLTNVASVATKTVADQLQNVDLEDVKSIASTTTEKGWGLAMDMWSTATQYVGEGVDQLSKYANDGWDDQGYGGRPPNTNGSGRRDSGSSYGRENGGYSSNQRDGGSNRDNYGPRDGGSNRDNYGPRDGAGRDLPAYSSNQRDGGSSRDNYGSRDGGAPRDNRDNYGPRDGAGRDMPSYSSSQRDGGSSRDNYGSRDGAPPRDNRDNYGSRDSSAGRSDSGREMPSYSSSNQRDGGSGREAGPTREMASYGSRDQPSGRDRRDSRDYDRLNASYGAQAQSPSASRFTDPPSRSGSAKIPTSEYNNGRNSLNSSVEKPKQSEPPRGSPSTLPKSKPNDGDGWDDWDGISKEPKAPTIVKKGDLAIDWDSW